MLGLIFTAVLIVLAILLLIFFAKAFLALVLIFAGFGLWNMGGFLGYAGFFLVLAIGWLLVQNDALP